MKFPRHAIPTPLEFACFCLMVVLVGLFWPVKAKATDYTKETADIAKCDAVHDELMLEPTYIDVRNMGMALFDEIEGQNNLGWQLFQALIAGNIDNDTYDAGIGFFNAANDQYSPYKWSVGQALLRFEDAQHEIDDGDSYYDQQNWEYATIWYRGASADFYLAGIDLDAASPHWHNAETNLSYCYYILIFHTVPPPPPPGP